MSARPCKKLRRTYRKGACDRNDLRERGALSPDGAVMADDRRRGEVVALDLAHEVLVDVRLPRHPAASAGGRSVGRSLWW